MAGLVLLGTLPARGQFFLAGVPEPSSTQPDPAKIDQKQETKQWLARGAELRKENRLKEAVAAYTRAIELTPNSSATYDDRGSAFRQLKDFPAARSDYDQALRLNPKNGVAYYNRALLFRDMGDQKACEADLRVAAAIGMPRAQALLSTLAGNSKVPAVVATPPPPSSANPPTAVAASWTGPWKVTNDWGTFNLVQQGGKITGKIIGGWAHGAISGVASGEEFRGQFQREGRTHIDGHVLLRMAPDGNSFTGQWKWAESPVYAASGFTGTRSSAAPTAAPDPLSDHAAILVGTWHSVASTVGTIEIKPDGTYVFNGNPGGKCHATAAGVDFEGSLAAWGSGHATLKNGSLEFYWTNPNGGINWFAFAK